MDYFSREHFLGKKNNYHFIYITVNKINGKKYLGKHSTYKINDGYLGCGVYFNQKISMNITSAIVRAILKYGKENFQRFDLLYFSNEEDAFRAESLLGKILNVVDSTDYYNLVKCGVGRCNFQHTETSKRRISLSGIGRVPWNKGVPMTDEAKINLSIKRKGKPIKGGKWSKEALLRNKGFRKSMMTDEIRDKISKSKTNPTQETLRKLSGSHIGYKMKEESKQKLREYQQSRPILICPYCGKSSRCEYNIKRWHFDNCKYKENERK